MSKATLVTIPYRTDSAELMMTNARRELDMRGRNNEARDTVSAARCASSSLNSRRLSYGINLLSILRAIVCLE